jgi:hypothetical protein
LKRAVADGANEAKAKARSSRKSKNAVQTAAEATTSASMTRRGQKRKSTVLEVKTELLDVEAKQSVPEGKVTRLSKVQVKATEVP